MYPLSVLNQSTKLSLQAPINYDWLSWRARIGQALAILTGQRAHLLDLQEELSHVSISSRRYAGIQNVPVGRIRGSENKAQDFNASFKPLIAKNRQRWERVADAQINGISLPPVKVIQVGEIYFVRDGHHRVSVAKEFGVKFVEAEVIVWEIGTTLPMDKFPLQLDPAHLMSGQCVHP